MCRQPPTNDQFVVIPDEYTNGMDPAEEQAKAERGDADRRLRIRVIPDPAEE